MGYNINMEIILVVISLLSLATNVLVVKSLRAKPQPAPLPVTNLLVVERQEDAAEERLDWVDPVPEPAATAAAPSVDSNSYSPWRNATNILEAAPQVASSESPIQPIQPGPLQRPRYGFPSRPTSEWTEF